MTATTRSMCIDAPKIQESTDEFCERVAKEMKSKQDIDIVIWNDKFVHAIIRVRDHKSTIVRI